MSQSDFLKDYYENKSKDLNELDLTYNNPSAFKRFFYRSRFNAVYTELDPKSGEKILDLGCGIGYYTRSILAQGSEVTSVEFSQGYLNQTKKLVGKNTRSKLIRASATSLPFPSNYFDKVLFTEVIEHIPDYENAVKEIKRVLRPNGIAVISTPFKYSPMNIGYYLKRYLRKYGFNEHVHEFTPGELKRLMSKYFIENNFKMANYLLPYPLDNLVMSIKNENHPVIKSIKFLDSFLAKVPLLNNLGWTMIITVQKGNK